MIKKKSRDILNLSQCDLKANLFLESRAVRPLKWNIFIINTSIIMLPLAIQIIWGSEQKFIWICILRCLKLIGSIRVELGITLHIVNKKHKPGWN